MTKQALVSILFLMGHTAGVNSPTPVTVNATVDSIDEDVARLDVEEYEDVYLPRQTLPVGTVEGDCVKIRAAVAGTNLRITVVEDKAECVKRRKAMQQLRKELRSK